MNKIIRTICVFTDNPTETETNELSRISSLFKDHGFIVQTTRLCSNNSKRIFEIDSEKVFEIFLSLGKLTLDESRSNFDSFINANNVSFNLDLTDITLGHPHVDILYDIVKQNAQKTFNFTYTFNNKHSSPFFPSAEYATNGFSIGLQPTDLSEKCNSLSEWFQNIENTWNEINTILDDEIGFLGIDTSIAPLFEGDSSFINFIKRLDIDFSHSTTTNTYLQITKFLKSRLPNNVGLCGLMFPCLEDYELADEYDNGNFSIERNIFLSLHSGLGIDTYPIGIDERPQRVLEILQLIQGLSHKYSKPLSVRFVSDGKTKIGQNSDFNNRYLKDVTIRPL